MICIFLGLAVALLYMISRYYQTINRPADGNSLMARLYVKRQIISLYLNILALILLVVLGLYIGQISSSFFDALWKVLLAILVIYIVSMFYARTQKLAKYIAPYVLKITETLLPIHNAISIIFSKLTKNSHGNIYDKQGLIDLIKSLKPDDEFKKTDLELASNSLVFSNLIVRDFYTPRKVVKFLDAEQEISTVLVDDLYKSGFSRFPVYSESQDNIVGTLYLKDLVEKRYSGKVSKIMSAEVYETTEDAKLDEVLRRFIKTKHHLFIVENEFKEIVGVITLEDVLEQLIGKEIVDESDIHEDMRIIAKS